MADRIYDPRLTPARPDLAARYLEGKIDAARFVDGETVEVVAPIAPVRREPRADAMQETQALLGERVTIYDRDAEGWAWGQLGSDGYVGWLPSSLLSAIGAAPTHRVTALRTFAFAGPSIKLPPLETLPFGARVHIAGESKGFAVTSQGWHLPLQHVGLVDCREDDAVAVAERFTGTPYLWGGKSSLGIDCSGLVQVSLDAAGVGCPRDSDMQESSLGSACDPGDLDHLQRGDLIFWKGHVAIVRDATTMVHANAHHMTTVIEPIREAVARIAAGGSTVTSIRRLSR